MSESLINLNLKTYKIFTKVIFDFLYLLQFVCRKIDFYLCKSIGLRKLFRKYRIFRDLWEVAYGKR